MLLTGDDKVGASTLLRYQRYYDEQIPLAQWLTPQSGCRSVPLDNAPFSTRNRFTGSLWFGVGSTPIDDLVGQLGAVFPAPWDQAKLRRCTAYRVDASRNPLDTLNIL